MPSDSLVRFSIEQRDEDIRSINHFIGAIFKCAEKSKVQPTNFGIEGTTISDLSYGRASVARTNMQATGKHLVVVRKYHCFTAFEGEPTHL